MMRYCCVHGCKNRLSSLLRLRRGITFHKFPDATKDPVRHRRWVANIRRKNFRPSRNSVVCSQHFLQEMIDRTGQTVRLRSHAIPTLFSFPDDKTVKATRRSKRIASAQKQSRKCITDTRTRSQKSGGVEQDDHCYCSKDTVSVVFTTGQKQKHSIVGELSYSPFFRTHVKTEPETDAIFFDLTGAAQTENDWQEVSMATTPELIKMECHDVNVECLDVLVKNVNTGDSRELHVLPCSESAVAVGKYTISQENEAILPDVLTPMLPISTPDTASHHSGSDLISNNVCSLTYDSLASNNGCHRRLTEPSKVEQPAHIICDLCGKNVARSTFYAHKRRHANGRQFLCEECGMSFFSLHELARHNRAPNVHTSHKCSTCSNVFFIRSEYRQHCKICRSTNNVLDENTEPYSLMYRCRACEKTMGDENSLVAHYKSVHPGYTPYFCSACDSVFYSVDNFRHHLVDCLSKSQVQQSEENPKTLRGHDSQEGSICKHCGKCFFKLPTLRKHLLTHVDHKLDACEVCSNCVLDTSSISSGRIWSVYAGKEISEDISKQLAKPSPLNYHNNDSGWGGSRHMCDKCGKKFASRKGLLLHQHSHAVCEKRICPTCGEAYKNLASHQRCHKSLSVRVESTFDGSNGNLQTIPPGMEGVHTISLAKQPRCRYCGKAFKFKSLMWSHMLTHGGTKPFICEICGKAYYSSSALRYHMQVHLYPVKFKCSICGRGFAKAFSLKLHAVVHSREKPHSCYICGNRFTQLGSLIAHRRNLHPDTGLNAHHTN